MIRQLLLFLMSMTCLIISYHAYRNGYETDSFRGFMLSVFWLLLFTWGMVRFFKANKRDVIDCQITYDDYKKLPGDYAIGKAKSLKKYWKRLSNRKTK